MVSRRWSSEAKSSGENGSALLAATGSLTSLFHAGTPRRYLRPERRRSSRSTSQATGLSEDRPGRVVPTIAWTSGAIRSAPRVGDHPARSVREGVAVLFGPTRTASSTP